MRRVVVVLAAMALALLLLQARTSLFQNSPKFAPDCGWWHHASGGKVDPPL
jgi:hypothetical protein